MKPVSHIASSSSRPPTLSHLSMESENRVLPVIRQVPQRQSIIPRESESGLQFGYLNCTPSRCFDNYFNSRLYTRLDFNDDCDNDRYTMASIEESASSLSSAILSTILHIFQLFAPKGNTCQFDISWSLHLRLSLSRLYNNVLKNICKIFVQSYDKLYVFRYECCMI